jgi:hypothetical protein
LLERNKRNVISKEQYKTREEFKKMAEEELGPEKKEDPKDKAYESRRDRKKEDSFDYKPYDSKPAKKEDSFDYKPYDSIEDRRRRNDSYDRDYRTPSDEKRKQPIESPERNKIEIGKYDSFSNQGSRDYNSPEPVKKALKKPDPIKAPEPVKMTRKKDSYEEEEKPKEGRAFGVFDRQDSYEEMIEKPKKNFVESKNVSKAPIDENNLQQDLLIITLKTIIKNQKEKIQVLEDEKKELDSTNMDKDKKIRELEEKIDDLETMGKLKEFTGDNTVDVAHLDEKLKNIDDYLDGIKYNPEQNKLIEDIIKKNQEYNDISKENANAMSKLRNNISNLKSTLNTLNVGD